MFRPGFPHPIRVPFLVLQKVVFDERARCAVLSDGGWVLCFLNGRISEVSFIFDRHLLFLTEGDLSL